MNRASISERYIIEREIGQGGMATVFLARDLKHDRPVALKVLRSDVASHLGLERFLREIRLTAQLHHPHILPVYDSGTLESAEGPSGPYYVMPLIEGESLRQRLEREGKLSIGDAVRIAKEVAEALDYAHRRNILHRDIKPENILLEEGHALVTDFGIARALGLAGDVSLTHAGLLVGTPLYMSPEQMTGEQELDGRSDIYSLACVLFEMVAGRPLFRSRTVHGLLAERLDDASPKLSDHVAGVPAALDRAVETGLRRLPSGRPATAAAFAELITGAVADTSKRPRSSKRATRGSQGSIAVLPFVNLSADQENEYFSDGMTEEVINALSQISGLRVTARSSAFVFKGKSLDARSIGKRLKVQHLLEGSVRKVGDRIRITAQLIDASQGYQVWSQVYDRTLADVFAVQDELAKAIATALTQRVGAASAPLVEPPTASIEAYTLYLKGCYAANQRTQEGIQSAIGLFEQSIERDPRFARAHAGLASCWTLRGFEEFVGDLPPKETMPKAKTAAQLALELEPTLGSPHCWLGAVSLLYDWDWLRAEAEFRKAMELAPEDTVSQVWYANYLGVMSRHDEALAILRRAEALDPISLIVHLAVGRALTFANRNEEALQHLRATAEMEPRYGLTRAWISRALSNMERYEEALIEIESGLSLAGPLPTLLAVAGYLYGRLGREPDARRIIDRLRQERQRRYLSPMIEAYVHLGLDDIDEHFRLAEQAISERSGWLAFTRVTPGLEHPYRQGPRFLALLEKMGLNF